MVVFMTIGSLLNARFVRRVGFRQESCAMP